MRVQDYERFIGAEAVDRILAKAQKLSDKHIVNISSTYYGGGVASKLSSLTLLMNEAGLKTGWRIIQGNPDFFHVTKSMHNALQGATVHLDDKQKRLFEQVNYENSMRKHLHHDIIIIHDPQPLSLIQHYPHNVPWIWRCHIDLTSPNPQVWQYLRKFIERFDAVVVSIPQYAQSIRPTQFFHMPATDPFSLINKDLSSGEIDEALEEYDIPTDLPIITQVSRFDKWKDPQGVIDAWKMVRKEVDCTLVLLGSAATDDPEGEAVYQSLMDQQEERLLIINREDSMLVNAVQRKAAVVIQKSIREGFGLTVTEAMWKGTPVVGGNVGGIRYQIIDGVNGFLVTSVEETAERTLQLLKDDNLQRQMGLQARETVKQKFLMTRLMEQYLDLFASFKIRVDIDEDRTLEKAMLE